MKRLPRITAGLRRAFWRASLRIIDSDIQTQIQSLVYVEVLAKNRLRQTCKAKSQRRRWCGGWTRRLGYARARQSVPRDHVTQLVESRLRV